MSKKISIVGAGVAGLCAARELLSRGATVTIYERGDGVGKHACSWWAGGMLAQYCEAETAEDIVVELGLEAADWWQKHTSKVKRSGTLVVSLARNDADLKQFSRRTNNHTLVNKQQIGSLEPDLVSKFNSGLYFKDEAHLSPRDALINLRESLLAEGVTFIHQAAEPKQLSNMGLTIDCRGFTAKNDIPTLRGVKGEMLILRCNDINISRPIRILHPRIPLYIVPRGDGVYMLGATMIESSACKNVTARSMLELLSTAYAVNPAFGEAEILEIGVDSRPAFPSNLPQLNRDQNLISINGLYRHGFLLAPSMARIVANHIYKNTPLEISNEH